jgi:hypothetical protein
MMAMVMALSLAISFLLLLSLVLVVSPSFFIGTSFIANAYTTTTADVSPLKVTTKASPSFKDSNGNLNVVGVVNNDGSIPVQVMLGLKIVDNNSNKSSSAAGVITTTTIQESPYGRTIYPSTASPFKFVVSQGWSVLGQPFIISVKKIVESPRYNDVLSLNYSNMGVGKDRALVGTIKNKGPFEIHNVSVYASVHDRNKTQIDSVKSNTIPIIKPGQEVAFSAVPDDTIKQNVIAYSCAGLNFNDPITTLEIGKGQYLAYDLRGVAAISDFRYENTTDSIMFGVRHYNPDGGLINLKIPQFYNKESVSVFMDGKKLLLYKDVSVKMDGKTVYIDFFVPKGEHKVQIQGVSKTI